MTRLRAGLDGFFFQAEDGIRDLTVTGVQTCALPICSPSKGLPSMSRGKPRIRACVPGFGSAHGVCERATSLGSWRSSFLSSIFAFGRSEERRIGKECRARWSRYHVEKLDDIGDLEAC